MVKPAPLRVLQVVLSLDPGGTERLVVDIASRLHADVPMHVCCLDARGAWAPQLEAQGIGVASLGRTPGFHPSLGRAVARAARTHRATVIHAHHYSPFVYSCLARVWHPRLPVVFTEHGRLSDSPPSGRRRVVNRVLAPRAARVLAVSEDLKQHMLGEGFRDHEIGVIHNGIAVGPIADPDARAAVRQTLGAADTSLVIGTIARLDPVKDLVTLLRAVALLAKSRRLGELRPMLVVVGDGPERAALGHTAEELGVAPYVQFLGHRDDARSLLPACDIYVNCSTSEGVSLTILEAMAAGLPVVATAVGGTPEVVTRDAGQLVPARDPAALADALASLADSADARRALGRAARQRVEAEFTIERMVHRYHDIYQEVA